MKTLTVDDLAAIKKRAEKTLELREKSNALVSEESCGIEKGTDIRQILCSGGTAARASEGAQS
jgi:NADH-quinone oxidoreductase subunit F/NADP-reducing hydrogenase subunit HndC